MEKFCTYGKTFLIYTKSFPMEKKGTITYIFPWKFFVTNKSHNNQFVVTVNNFNIHNVSDQAS